MDNFSSLKKEAEEYNKKRYKVKKKDNKERKFFNNFSN